MPTRPSGCGPARLRPPPMTATALNAAMFFEIDDVIDPADTRALISATLAASAVRGASAANSPLVDTW